MYLAYIYQGWHQIEKIKSVDQLDPKDQNRLGDALHDKFEDARFLSRSHFPDRLKLALSVGTLEYLTSLTLMDEIADACAAPD